MIYRTCVGCMKAKEPCAHRDYLRLNLAGLGITSIKFSCPDRKSLFNPGDPVWVELYVSDIDEDEPQMALFPATIIRVVGSQAVARVALDAKSDCCGYDFEPKNESGFVKRSLKWIRPREGERHVVCPVCSAFDGEHEYGWICFTKAKNEREAAERSARQASEVIF